MALSSVLDSVAGVVYADEGGEKKFPIMWLFLGIIVVIMLCFLFGVFRVEDFFCFISNSGVLGLVVLFFVCLIANAALFLPTPLYVLLVVVGAVEFLHLGFFSPLLVGVIAATGGSLGEFSGYIVGYLGVTTFNKMSNKEVHQLKVLKEKLDEMGMLLLVIFAFAPLPFDAVGIVAGLARYSKIKFFVGCWLGKAPKYILVAYAGYFGIGFLLGLFGISPDYLVVTCAQAALHAVSGA